ncbi:MAG: hypothetical protein DRR08_29090 [Candidatus Parabeggiatoa sp. nov. 2]|nr:MAG: hypothetical protein B6247_06595 [Beggiatoa sp. 4572_84]RKZ51601.1 MAG: hypothetical protein DRR08_29090 [Gammaproteobacteria bacterium]
MKNCFLWAINQTKAYQFENLAPRKRSVAIGFQIIIFKTRRKKRTKHRNPFGVGVVMSKLKVFLKAIHIQPLWGWRMSFTFSTGFP